MKKNNNGFLITCISSIVILLTICYFGINSLSSKGTRAATTCPYLSSKVSANGFTYCCPNSSDTIQAANGSSYCVPKNVTLHGTDAATAYCQYGTGDEYLSYTLTSQEKSAYEEFARFHNGGSAVYSFLLSSAGESARNALISRNLPGGRASGWYMIPNLSFDFCGFQDGSENVIQCYSYAFEAKLSDGCAVAAHEATPATYTWTVNFNANGGTLEGKSSLSCTTKSGENFCELTNSSSFPKAKKEGYTFKGWVRNLNTDCKEGSVQNLLTKIRLVQDEFVYACYEKSVVSNETKSNNITFKKDGYDVANSSQVSITFSSGSASISQECKFDSTSMIGSTCYLNSPSITVPTGYEFVGWGFINNNKDWAVKCSSSSNILLVTNGKVSAGSVPNQIFEYYPCLKKTSTPDPNPSDLTGHTCGQTNYNTWTQSSCNAYPGKDEGKCYLWDSTNKCCEIKNYVCSGPSDQVPTEKQFTVIYNGNGGKYGNGSEVWTSDKIAKKGEHYSIYNNETSWTDKFVRSGYKWIGWTTKSNGSDDGYGWTNWSGTWTFDNGERGIANDTLTLYARWQKVNVNNQEDQNVDTNPGTGSIAIFIVWVIGIAMIIYSIYYFRKLKKYN